MASDSEEPCESVDIFGQEGIPRTRDEDERPD